MNQKNVNLRMLMIAAPVIVAFLLISKVTHRPVRWDSGYRPVMGTLSRVVVIGPNERIARQSGEKVYKYQQWFDNLMSTYKDYTELSEVNREAYDGPVHVSPETMEVLQRAVAMSKLTGGTFDVTIGPLMDLWKHAADTNTMPTQQMIDEAKAKVGWQHLRLDPNAMTVQFEIPGMKLDVGGIAKGYAIDKSVDILKSAGALGGMVDIGGDLMCFGMPPYGHKAWRIAVQDPNVAPDDMSPDKYLMVLTLDDQAVATSGHYRRFALIDGHKISHIITPKTGSGQHYKSASTSILAPDATTADGLATAVSILGPKKGLDLINGLDHIEALIIVEKPDGPQFIESKGMGAYLKASVPKTL